MSAHDTATPAQIEQARREGAEYEWIDRLFFALACGVAFAFFALFPGCVP